MISRHGERRPGHPGQGEALDLVAPQTHHAAASAASHEFHRLGAEACCQDAIIGGRATAALDVAENRHPRLQPGHVVDLSGHGDPHLADGIAAVVTVGEAGHGHSMRPRALGHHDNAEASSPAPPLDEEAGDGLRAVADLWNQNDVTAPRDPGREGEPAGAVAHHLDDHDPVMGRCCAVQPVDALRGDRQAGVKADGLVSAAQIVIDGLRDADDREALLRELVRLAMRAVAADADQRIELQLAVALDNEV